MRRRSRDPVIPISLREIYTEPGEYVVKLMIDPDLSSEIDGARAVVTNADGSPLRQSFRRWGTKLTVGFTIDQDTPDGVATIDVSLAAKDRTIPSRFMFWVIK